jgi:putative ABC transport system permease protein
MLTGDRVKYYGLIFGIAFSTLLIAQQSTLFVNLMLRASAAVWDVTDADIWVMDQRRRRSTRRAPLPDQTSTGYAAFPASRGRSPCFARGDGANAARHAGTGQRRRPR